MTVVTVKTTFFTFNLIDAAMNNDNFELKALLLKSPPEVIH